MIPSLRRLLRGLLCLLLPAVAARPAGVVLPAGFHREVLAGPELTEALDLNLAPDGSAWITGRQGHLWRLDPSSRAVHLAGRLEVDFTDDRGLHGLALDPEFATNGRVYLFYQAAGAPHRTYTSRISRFTLHGTGGAAQLDRSSETVLLEFSGHGGGQHVGGALLMHPVERLLYVSTGDNNPIARLASYADDPDNQAQSRTDLRGKVLRLGLDGSIPPSNPFAHTPGARGEIFTMGHRQPWQLEYDTLTGAVLLAENGGDALDDHEEVNLLRAGANYGWPRVFADGLATLGRTNRVEGFTPPWFHYVRHQGGSCTGALVYRASGGPGGFPDAYRDGLFYADYNRKSVRFAPIDRRTLRPGPSQAFVQNLPGGPVALRTGPDGSLYLVEYSGWFRPTDADTVTRIVWRP